MVSDDHRLSDSVCIAVEGSSACNGCHCDHSGEPMVSIAKRDTVGLVTAADSRDSWPVGERCAVVSERAGDPASDVAGWSTSDEPSGHIECRSVC